MSEVRHWFVKAVYSMDHVVRLVPEGGWDRPSPCEGWTGRHVLGHVIAIQSYYVASLDRRPPPMDPYAAPDRHAGPHPAETWANVRDAVLRALDSPDVLDGLVTTVTGEQARVEDLIAHNPLDTTVHSWDLARAAGVDDRLDPGLVRHCLALVGGLDGNSHQRDPRFYAPALRPAGAGDQAALLAAVGRRGE